jgi:hypothetical protein
MNPGFHRVRTRRIRGFIAFQLVRRTRIVMLMVPVCPESGFWRAPAPAAGSRSDRDMVLVVLMCLVLPSVLARRPPGTTS